MDLLSLFSGIGAFEKALTNIGVDYNLVNYCEIDKYASTAYSAIHNVSEDENLGDVRNIDTDKLPNIDMITHGSPCQDFSIAGKQKGGDKGSNTRSSLMWHTIEIIEETKPTYVIWENVKNILSVNHKENFIKYRKKMNSLGYKNKSKIINAKDWGIPQNRERIFVVSYRKGDFSFPISSLEGQQTLFNKTVINIPKYKTKDFCEKNIVRKVKSSLKKYFNEKYYKDYNSENGCIKLFDGVEQGYFNSGFSQNRIWSYEGNIPTITTKAVINIGELKGRLTPLECWRLMGFKDKDFYTAQNEGISDNQLYKMAGNSIVVPILEYIFINLFNVQSKKQVI